MRLLVITEKIREKIRNRIEYANLNPITLAELKKIATGIIGAPGDFEEYAMYIPFGFRCVYTVEIQSIGKCRHISISINSGRDGKWPSEEAVIMIAKEFGFRGNVLEDSHIYTEKQSNAVNLIQSMTTH